MNHLVVYYSLDGNCKLIAETIAATIEADLIDLQTRKKYPANGFRKYFWCGKSAIFAEKPALSNDDIDFSRYEVIILGTPIWAGKLAPPLRSLISRNRFQGKHVALFACHSGGGAEKCFRKIKQVLPGNVFMSETDFIDPIKNPQENLNKAAGWARGLINSNEPVTPDEER